MKKRVGILYGKPIIVGDKNDQTVNEVYLSSQSDSKNVLEMEMLGSGDIIKINNIEYNVHSVNDTSHISDSNLLDYCINNEIKDAIIWMTYNDGNKTGNIKCNSIAYENFYDPNRFLVFHFVYQGMEMNVAIYPSE